MDKIKLAKEIRRRAAALDNTDGIQLPEEDLRDDGELLRVLARVLEGRDVEQAFGAPGDWGYTHPIARAMIAQEKAKNG